MVLEINYFRDIYPTTNTDNFKKFINPVNPVIQSAANINAPPFFPIHELYVLKNQKCMTSQNLLYIFLVPQINLY